MYLYINYTSFSLPISRFRFMLKRYLRFFEILSWFSSLYLTLFFLHLVKIWSTETEHSVATIDGKANICCVKFNPENPYHLAFGSAGTVRRRFDSHSHICILSRSFLFNVQMLWLARSHFPLNIKITTSIITICVIYKKSSFCSVAIPRQCRMWNSWAARSLYLRKYLFLFLITKLSLRKESGRDREREERGRRRQEKEEV